MPDVYSTYEAKSRFSEIIRRVRSGERVIVAYRGEEVAEIRPVEPPAEGLEARLVELRRKGLLVPSKQGKSRLEALAKRPGALQRFLRSRED